jgi:hypothetical protein
MGKSACSPRGTVGIESIKSDVSQNSQAGRLDHMSTSQRHSKAKLSSSGWRPLISDGSHDGQTGRLVSVSRGQTQGLHSIMLKPRGTTKLESTQIRWFSWYSGGRLDRLPKRGDQTVAEWQTKTRGNLFFFRGWWRRRWLRWWGENHNEATGLYGSHMRTEEPFDSA